MLFALPELASDTERLKTYRNYPDNAGHSASLLCRLGFAYNGTLASVVCIYCGTADSRLATYHSPLGEHGRKVPYCIQKRKRALAAIKLFSQGVLDPVHPCYADLYARKVSFASWPIQISQTGNDLSRAGFYYADRCDEVVLPIKTKIF